MNDEKEMGQNDEEIPEEKKRFIIWIKDHKTQLIFAGVGITTLVATVIGLKNKDALIALWNSLKEEIEKGSLYSVKWFENASLEELKEARKVVQQDYRNPELDMDIRSKCWELLAKFDKAIGEKEWAGKVHAYPVYSENGWHLRSND